jgi:hypothetical protein
MILAEIKLKKEGSLAFHSENQTLPFFALKILLTGC